MVSHHGERSWPAGETLGEGARDQSSERYSSMFTHHPHATYSVDPRGYFTDANDAVARDDRAEPRGDAPDPLRAGHPPRGPAPHPGRLRPGHGG